MAAGAVLQCVLRDGRKERPHEDAALPLCKKRAALCAAYRDAACQFITSVLMRFGTSPTGMTALTFMLAVSIAVTDRSPELEM